MLKLGWAKEEALSFLAWIGLVLLVLVLFACGHKQKDTQDTSLLGQAQSKGDTIYGQVSDRIYRERCDKLTFKGMLSAYSSQNLDPYESNGQWIRDDLPCYPTYSVSSISLDGVLGVLHHIVATRDAARLNRLISYGEAHNWIMGQGPSEYTNIYALVPFIYSLKKKLSLADENMNLVDLSVQTQEILSGFRGHLLADYIWLTMEKDGQIGELELQLLKQLVSASPGEPMYQALLHRVVDGDQTIALTLLLTDPTYDDSTVMRNDSAFGWGSQPAAVSYLVTLAIVEGK